MGGGIFYERCERKDRYERVKLISAPLPKVARIGEWIAGEALLGTIPRSKSSADFRVVPVKPDREQFLSFAAQTNADFFVTKDRAFLQARTRREIHEKFGFLVGTPRECVHWLTGSNLPGAGITQG